MFNNFAFFDLKVKFHFIFPNTVIILNFVIFFKTSVSWFNVNHSSTISFTFYPSKIYTRSIHSTYMYRHFLYIFVVDKKVFKIHSFYSKHKVFINFSRQMFNFIILPPVHAQNNLQTSLKLLRKAYTIFT